MRRCILCRLVKEDSKFNDEHIFQKSIGGTLVINNVCTNCNSNLGSVDAFLTDNFLIKLKRHKLRIKNYDGVVPNPLKYKSSFEDGSPAKIEFHSNGEYKGVYAHRQLNASKIDDRIVGQITYNQSDKDDKQKAIKELNKYLRKNGLPPMTEEEIEAKFIKVSYRPKVTLELKEKDYLFHPLPLIKIAFEFTHLILGDRFLEDRVAIAMRKALRGESFNQDLLKGRFGLPQSFILDLLSKKFPESHCALLINEGSGICCVLKIFDTIESILHVSSNAKKYKAFESVFVVNDPVDGSIKFIDFIDYVNSFSDEELDDLLDLWEKEKVET